MFGDIESVKRANKENGYHFFDYETMKFFASRIESKLYKNQCFITSEKKCFDEYRRVYSVRKALPNGAIQTIAHSLESVTQARELIKRLPN